MPAGTHRFEARRIGFLSAPQSVTVVAGQAVVADFSLATSPITLEAVKTVGYGTQEARTVTGAVATVNSAFSTSSREACGVLENSSESARN